jgi:hypothetical protein
MILMGKGGADQWGGGGQKEERRAGESRNEKPGSAEQLSGEPRRGDSGLLLVRRILAWAGVGGGRVNGRDPLGRQRDSSRGGR